MITNPNPVTATFSGMWISRLSIILPREGRKGTLIAVLNPYDADTQILLATGLRRVQVGLPTESEALIDAIEAAIAEVQRIANTNSEVADITVTAHDPKLPVGIAIRFTEGKGHAIKDAFALASTDSQFATAFTTVMAAVASEAGL